MKDESGMTKDIEQVAKELRNKYYEPFSMPKEDFAKLFEQGVETNWVNVAKYVQRQVRIAYLEGSIQEQMVYGGSRRHERIPELSAQLAEAEKESK